MTCKCEEIVARANSGGTDGTRTHQAWRCPRCGTAWAVPVGLAMPTYIGPPPVREDLLPWKHPYSRDTLGEDC